MTPNGRNALPDEISFRGPSPDAVNKKFNRRSATLAFEMNDQIWFCS